MRPGPLPRAALLFLIQAKAPVGAGIVADVDADLRAGLLDTDAHAVDLRRGQILKQHGAVFLRDEPVLDGVFHVHRVVEIDIDLRALFQILRRLHTDARRVRGQDARRQRQIIGADRGRQIII